MSGYQACKVGISADATVQYIDAMLAMVNESGQSLGQLLLGAEGGANYLSDNLDDDTIDRKKRYENSDLNREINVISGYIRDGDIINIEAKIPGKVVGDFFKDKLSDDYWNLRDRHNMYIVTVADKNQDGTPVMETYTDLSAGGEERQRPSTSVRVVSYNPHRGNSESAAEETIVYDEIVIGALEQLGLEMAQKGKAYGQRILDAIKSKSYDPAARSLGGQCTELKLSGSKVAKIGKGSYLQGKGRCKMVVDDSVVDEVGRRKGRGRGRDKVL